MSSPDASGSAVLHEAMAFHRAGRLAEADQRYAAWLRDHPRHADALRLRGILARETGELERSMKLLRAATDAAPDDAEPAAELGLSCVAAGYLHLAEAALRKALARDPASRKALANLGALHQHRGHLAAAIDCHQSLLRLEPDDIEVRCNLAWALVEAGRGDEALAECGTALATAPHRPELLATKGGVLVALGQYEAAVPCLESALESGPDDMALINLALAREQTGAAEEAREILEAALRVNPDNARAMADLVSLLAGAGRADEAVTLSGEFLGRHPGERLVLAARSVALRDAGRGEEARALVDLERLVFVREPAVPRGYRDFAAFNAGLADCLLRDPSLMQSPLTKATRGGAQTGELDPDSSPALRALKELLDAEIRAVVGSLGKSGFDDHPVMAWASKRWTLRMWGTVLRAGGHQLPHLHPLAWLSGVYYVQVPPMSGDDGALEFGEPPPRVRARTEPDRRRVRPVPGRLVMFPSWFWHRTLPFDQAGERISIAFDVIPAET